MPSSSVNNEVDHSATVANSVDSSQETNKENAAPGPPQSDAQTSSSDQRPPTLSEPTAIQLTPDVLPPQITAMLAEITGILNETFHTYPPHTIQRLAELVLEPRRYYRSLPSYLHAVDRVVHVTSGNNIYPLPPAIPDMSHMSINGVTDAHNEDGSVDGRPSSAAVWASSSIGAPIGSDEALGGALLSPIPWLLRGTSNGDEAGSDAGSEPSTLSAGEAGPSPAGGAMASSHQQQNPSAAQQHRPGQGQRHFERQVRTESTETIEGPNGMGSIETVTVSINGISSMSAAQQQRVITQGELIRQEQRAGAAPAGQSARAGPVVASVSQANDPSSSPTSEEAENDTTMTEDEDEDHQEKNEEAPSAQTMTATGTTTGTESTTANDNASEKSDEEMADEDGAPHARGPDLIGAEDMGPQTPSSSTFSISSGGNSEMHSIDVEAAVGRKNEAQIPAAAAATANGAEHKGDNTPSESSSEDAVVLTPASTDREASRESTEQAAAAAVGSSLNKATNSEASKVQEDKPEANNTPLDQPQQQQPAAAAAAESMDTEPDPSSPPRSIVSTTPSLGKREAENGPEDELDSKRLKGSPLEDDEQQNTVENARLASGGETQSASKTTASLTPAGKESDDQSQEVAGSTTTKDETDKQDATSSSTAQALPSKPKQQPATGGDRPDATSTANIPATGADADADADAEDADPNLQIEQEVKAAAVAAEAEAAKEEKEKEKNVTGSAPA